MVNWSFGLFTTKVNGRTLLELVIYCCQILIGVNVKNLFAFILIWFVSLLGWLAPARAADNPLPATVQIVQNEATPHFPDNIRYDLRLKINDTNLRFSKIELRYRLLDDPETAVRPAKLESRPNGELAASLEENTNKDYIPPGTRLSYYWFLYDNKGGTYSLPTKEFTYNDTRFNFRELKSGVVTLRWYQGDANFGQAALNKATATIAKLGKLYNLIAKNAINITIYPDSRSMFTALPPNTAEWVGGQAIPTLGTIVLAIAPGDLNEIGRSIPHEVSHQVVYQATRNPYNSPPPWLDEGLAVSNQDGVEPTLEDTVARAITKRELFPLRVLNAAFPADSQQSYLAYGQSLKVVQFIITRYGPEALAKILASFKEGVTYDEAVQRGLGIGLDDLDREWKLSINYPVDPVQVAATTTPIASITVAQVPATSIRIPPTTDNRQPTTTPTVPLTTSSPPTDNRQPTTVLATARIVVLSPTPDSSATIGPNVSETGNNSANSGNLPLLGLIGGLVLLILGGGIWLIIRRNR